MTADLRSAQDPNTRELGERFRRQRHSRWLLGALLVLATAVASAVSWTGSTTDQAAAQTQPVTCVEEYGTTGGTQSFEVPAGVTEITVDAWGAQGGNVTIGTTLPKARGGFGAAALGTVVPVAAGDQVEILVGGAGTDGAQAGPGGSPGQGGFNGGADGGDADFHFGGGGGGASSVLLNGTPLVIAGGGGGASHADPAGPPNGNGGHGGLNGTDGTGGPNPLNAQPGQGATPVAGGAGGAGSQAGAAGAPGTAGQGGVGGNSSPGGPGDGGGGGGGGAFGGGGGGGSQGAGVGAAGGGGSSMGQPDTAFQTGVKQGDGFVRVTYEAEQCGPPDTCVEEIGLTGGPEVWGVPAGVDEITIDAYGAQGGDFTGGGFTAPTPGGRGGAVIDTVLPVSPGDNIELLVGGAGQNVDDANNPGGVGGFNGGGDGGNGQAHQGGGGGGATTVSYNGQVMVIAGGGGGAGHTSDVYPGAGGAGGLNGEDGTSDTEAGNAQPGFGATTTAGGDGGAGDGPLGTDGADGTAGQGGDGGEGGFPSVTSSDGGGGGGGGLFGGGGGGGGDFSTGSGSTGGGGSSMGQPDSTFATGVKEGDGLVRITYQQEGCGVADLAITKTAAAAVAPGGQITWTMTITNNGPEPSTGSTVSDPIPAGITGAATSTPGCSVTGGTLTCAVGPLDVGGSTEVVLTGNAPATGGTCVTNGATVDGQQHDPEAANNTSTVTTCTTPLPPGPANVTIDKTVSAPRVTVGETVSFRMVARNNGPGVAVNAKVDDNLPSRLDARTASSEQGTCSVAGNRIHCELGTMAVGQEVTITVRARAIRSGRATNTATVDSESCSTHPCDEDPARVTIVKPKLRLSKAVDQRTLRAGETTNYTIRVSNPSDVRVSNVRTCDRLPAGLVYVSSKPTARLTGGQHCWTVRQLAAGASRTYRVVVRALRGTDGRRVNTATATSPDARRAQARRAVRVIGGQVAPGGGVTG
jgi:uncharacterized repeat protein (TIGR01451 family)